MSQPTSSTCRSAKIHHCEISCADYHENSNQGMTPMGSRRVEKNGERRRGGSLRASAPISNGRGDTKESSSDRVLTAKRQEGAQHPDLANGGSSRAAVAESIGRRSRGERVAINLRSIPANALAPDNKAPNGASRHYGPAG